MGGVRPVVTGDRVEGADAASPKWLAECVSSVITLCAERHYRDRLIPPSLAGDPVFGPMLAEALGR